MTASIERLSEITDLIQMLSDQEQEVLLRGLRKQILLAKAERLNRSVKPNSIKMSDILIEIQQVRHARHAS